MTGRRHRGVSAAAARAADAEGMLDALRTRTLTSASLAPEAEPTAAIGAALREGRLSPDAALTRLAPGARSPGDAWARVLASGDEEAIAIALTALQQLPAEARSAALAGVSADLLALLARALGAGASGSRGASARPALAPVGRGPQAPAPAPLTSPPRAAASAAPSPAVPFPSPTDTVGAPAPTTPSSAGRYKPLLDLIGRHESQSAGGYDAMNQGGTHGGHGVVGYSGPAAPFLGKPLTQMTVQEVMDRQNPALYPQGGAEDRGIHAAGRYQIIGSTLKALVQRGVVSPSDRFDEATQDKLGAALIEGRRGQGLSGLRSEWIGLTHASDAELSAAVRAAGL